MATVKETIDGMDRLRKELATIRRSSPDDEDFRDATLNTWAKRAYKELQDWGFLAEAEQGFGRNSPIKMYAGVDVRAKMRDDILRALRDDMASHPGHYESKLASAGQPESVSARTAPSKPHRIFLGHGGNKVWARVHMHLRDELRLEVEAWESQPRAGMHSVEVLRGLLTSCTFAVIVATKEDVTVDGGTRARQNVVHEVGLFQGRFGFEKVAVLEQDGIEGFSNLAGLQVIRFPNERVEAGFYELDRMLKREGLIKLP